jgi:hypothetical protein
LDQAFGSLGQLEDDEIVARLNKRGKPKVESMEEYVEQERLSDSFLYDHVVALFTRTVGSKGGGADMRFVFSWWHLIFEAVYDQKRNGLTTVVAVNMAMWNVLTR